MHTHLPVDCLCGAVVTVLMPRQRHLQSRLDGGGRGRAVADVDAPDTEGAHGDSHGVGAVEQHDAEHVGCAGGESRRVERPAATVGAARWCFLMSLAVVCVSVCCVCGVCNWCVGDLLRRRSESLYILTLRVSARSRSP